MASSLYTQSVMAAALGGAEALAEVATRLAPLAIHGTQGPAPRPQCLGAQLPCRPQCPGGPAPLPSRPGGAALPSCPGTTTPEAKPHWAHSRCWGASLALWRRAWGDQPWALPFILPLPSLFPRLPLLTILPHAASSLQMEPPCGSPSFTHGEQPWASREGGHPGSSALTVPTCYSVLVMVAASQEGKTRLTVGWRRRGRA